MASGFATLAGGTITIVTNLQTVVSATVSLKTSSTPGDDPVALSIDFGGAILAGSILVSAWKTDGTDPTLTPSTSSTAVVSWLAFGS